MPKIQIFECRNLVNKHLPSVYAARCKVCAPVPLTSDVTESGTASGDNVLVSDVTARATDDVSELVSAVTERLTTCPICLVQYVSKEKAFPCGHVICVSCVTSLAQTQHPYKPQVEYNGRELELIKCPMCRGVWYPADQLRDDTRNKQFLQVINAVHRRGSGKRLACILYLLLCSDQNLTMLQLSVRTTSR